MTHFRKADCTGTDRHFDDNCLEKGTMDRDQILSAFDRIVKQKYQLDIVLKDEQLELIHAVLNGRHSYGVLPSGWGRSMCFTLPPLILDEIDDTRHSALVISPLHALMKNQVDVLNGIGVGAVYIGSAKEDSLMTAIREGKFSVIFTSPEAIFTSKWRTLLLSKEYKAQLCLVCFDEAQCVSKWGGDFRPEYKEANMIRSFSKAPVLALTEICTEEIRRDVISCLILPDSPICMMAKLPDRPNVFLHQEKCREDFGHLEWIVDYLHSNGKDAKKILIYCRSINITAELYCHLADLLVTRGVSQLFDKRLLEMFHECIVTESKERIRNDFKKKDSRIRCVIVTNAFDMGIDFPDVAIVIHWGVPKTAMTYWQEVSTAGRSGEESVAICYGYERSVNLKHTDSAMIKMMSEDTECFRYSVLETLSLKERNKNELLAISKKTGCERSCTNPCQCDFCRCCSLCFRRCQCTNKCKTFLSRFGIDG